MFENIKHDMYTNLKQTSFSWDKRDRINNMSPGIWTSWKHTARLYSISTVPWSQEGFYVIYLAGSGDATCFVLPSMQMRVWLCVCVCVYRRESARERELWPSLLSTQCQLRPCRTGLDRNKPLVHTLPPTLYTHKHTQTHTAAAWAN